LPLGQRKETASLKQKSYKMRFLQLKQKIDSKKSFFSAKLVFVDLQIILQGNAFRYNPRILWKDDILWNGKKSKSGISIGSSPQKNFSFHISFKVFKRSNEVGYWHSTALSTNHSNSKISNIFLKFCEIYFCNLKHETMKENIFKVLVLISFNTLKYQIITSVWYIIWNIIFIFNINGSTYTEVYSIFEERSWN
jgi:hypothetical protein